MKAMEFTDREKRILLLAALVALAFVITRVLPMLQDVYQQRQENIDAVQLDIQREQRLIENTARWHERRQAAQARQGELERQVFNGATVALIEAAIQRDLTQYARDSGIGVTSTRLAEQLQTEGWILVSQEMAFRTDDAANTVSFLERLEDSIPRLFVREFSLNRTRNQYNGSITVVGFARADDMDSASQQERP